MSAIGDDLYVFGGRGGKEMAPLPANIYKFSTKDHTWSQVDVLSGTIPEARSFHAMAVSEVNLISELYNLSVQPPSPRVITLLDRCVCLWWLPC